MELKALETKCPVCGPKNVPVKFSTEIGGGGMQVKAKYFCEGKVRRIFRRARICQTQYRIILRHDAAERVIREIHADSGTGYGTKEDKEG